MSIDNLSVNQKFPNVRIKLGYTSGFSQEYSHKEVLRRFGSEELSEGIGWIEFKYFVPVINKDLQVVTLETKVRYVVGAEMCLKEFQKLIKMNTLNLNIESNFNNKIKNASSVCIIRPLCSNIYPQQVFVIDDNTKMFDTLDELIEASKNFLLCITQFYSPEKLECYLNVEGPIR